MAASDLEYEDALSCLFFFIFFFFSFCVYEVSMEKREQHKTRAPGPVFLRERLARHGKES